ncbi:hypothetical protein MYP14_18880 [Rhodococcus pyridinivorans]|nr:hypothetical protein [Rhodococcus pyridinivorans]UPK62803.1 hypothetical protein MYP14_18880 [Rhodococcus pyridinivorans]
MSGQLPAVVGGIAAERTDSVRGRGEQATGSGGRVREQAARGGEFGHRECGHHVGDLGWGVELAEVLAGLRGA